jgi:DNA-binding beta-propeller fold protein YncE
MSRKVTKTLILACCTAMLFCPAIVFSRDIAMNNSGTLLFTANVDAHSISLINIANLTKQGEFKVEFQPESLTLDSQDRIWVTFRRDDAVGVYDPASGSTIALIEVGDEPFGVLPISATQVVVSLYQASELLLINTDSFAIENSLITAAHPRGLMVKSSM